ncbi:MAG: hypothetical protein ABIN18_10105 [Pseudomonadota bacterium]
MTDEQIEELIWDELKKRDVTFYDMISLPDYGVDPNPEDKTEDRNQRIRHNRFNDILGSARMKELLCEGEYNPYDYYPPLKIPLQDLFSFWWNRCVEKEAVVDEILEDIFDYFTDQMRPPEKKKESMDLIVDFGQLQMDQAA